jgi:hypothetical protein
MSINYNYQLDKRAMSISIVLLVIMVFVIIGICLMYFILYVRDTGSTLHIPDKIDSLYTRQNYLDFYLKDIFEKSTKDFNFGNSKGEFIERFKNNLYSYKNKNGNYDVIDLNLIQSQITEENVNLDNDKISLGLNIVLESGDENDVLVKYGYNYLIQKDFETDEIKSFAIGNNALINNMIVKPDENNINPTPVIPTATNPTNSQSLGVYQFIDGVALEADIYYNYSNKWYWSFQYNVEPKYIEWRPVDSNYHKSSGMNLKNQAFIETLRGKNCDEGLNLLISRAIKNDEGGLVNNARVYFYSDSKSGEIELLQGIDCSSVSSHLKS